MAQLARGAVEPTEIAGVAVDPAQLFPEEDGFFARRTRARRTQLLERVRQPLLKTLAPGEVVRFATTGYRYSPWEYYFAGYAAYHHNQVAVVVTDRRLILLQLKGKTPGDLKHQLALAAIRSVSVSLLGRVILKLADGEALQLIRVPRADRKLLRSVASGVSGAAVPGPALEALCPACLAPVPGKIGATLTCPSLTCRIPFRDPVRAARLSGLVPGLGDLYLGHHLFGSIEFLGSMFALAVGLGVLAERDAAASVYVLVVTLALPRIVDFPLTLHMGRKGLVPLALAPAPGAQARNLPMFPRWAPLLFLAGCALTAALAWSMAAGH